MRKLLIVVLIVLVVAVVVLRQRLFLRDPLGKLYVNNVEITTARVFINYTNDVVVTTANTDASPAIFLVQHWDGVPGRPQAVNCMSTLVCLSEDDHANKVPLGGRNYNPKTTMSDRDVTFVDYGGDTQHVVIR